MFGVAEWAQREIGGVCVLWQPGKVVGEAERSNCRGIGAKRGVLHMGEERGRGGGSGSGSGREGGCDKRVGTSAKDPIAPKCWGFVTHCGWNSILESIALGIPLITWPFSADQHSNALLVEKLGVGERVCQGQHAVPDRGELARAVRRLVGEGEGEEGDGMRMRMRAQELRRAAREAVHQGGSSSSNLQDFVASIQTLAHNNL